VSVVPGKKLSLQKLSQIGIELLTLVLCSNFQAGQMPISPSADDHAQVTIVTFISVTLSFLNHFLADVTKTTMPEEISETTGTHAFPFR